MGKNYREGNEGNCQTIYYLMKIEIHHTHRHFQKIERSVTWSRSSDWIESLAGPLITLPEGPENLEPWQGQSKDFCNGFHVTVHPR